MYGCVCVSACVCRCALVCVSCHTLLGLWVLWKEFRFCLLVRLALLMILFLYSCCCCCCCVASAFRSSSPPPSPTLLQETCAWTLFNSSSIVCRQHSLSTVFYCCFVFKRIPSPIEGLPARSSKFPIILVFLREPSAKFRWAFKQRRDTIND